MATYICTVAGTERTLERRGLTIRAAVNAVGTLQGVLLSEDASFRPSIGDEILVTRDGTRIFGGNLTAIREFGAVGVAGTPLGFEVSASDFNAIAQRKYVTATIATGTLKAAATALVAYMSSEGVSLDSGQANGPTLPEIPFISTRLKDALDLVAKASGWTYRIDYNKKLLFTQPGATAAPWDLTEGDGSECGDVVVEPTLNDDYANRIYLEGGRVEQIEREENFTGDGTTTKFFPEFVVTKLYGYVYYSVTGNNETLGYSGDPGTPFWIFDPSDNSITRSAGAPASSSTVTFKFDGYLDITAQADDATEQSTRGIWEAVERVSGVFSQDVADLLADQILAERTADQAVIRYPTRIAGLFPGQTQHLDVTKRDLDDDCLITEVAIGFDDGEDVVYQITLSKGLITKSSDWRTTIEDWSRKSQGTGANQLLAVLGNPTQGLSLEVVDGLDALLSSQARSGFGVIYNRGASGSGNDEAWATLAGADGFDSYWGLFNRSAARAAFMVYNVGGNIYIAPPATRSHNVYLGHPTSSSLRFDGFHPNLGTIKEGGHTTGNGEWTTYSPTLGGTGASIGAGTLSGRWAWIAGHTLRAEIALTLAADTVLGSGPTFTLPQTAAASTNSSLGTAILIDAGTATYVCVVQRLSTTTVRALRTTEPASVVTSTAPFTWGANDQMFLVCEYDAA